MVVLALACKEDSLVSMFFMFCRHYWFYFFIKFWLYLQRNVIHKTRIVFDLSVGEEDMIKRGKNIYEAKGNKCCLCNVEHLPTFEKSFCKHLRKTRRERVWQIIAHIMIKGRHQRQEQQEESTPSWKLARCLFSARLARWNNKLC